VHADRVRRRICDGVVDEAICVASFFACPAGSLTFEASGQNLPRGIFDFTTITSPAPIAAVGAVTKVAVRIESLNHTFDGDLVINLIAPNGQRSLLFNRRGGGGENFVNTVFDDACSGTPIFNGNPPYPGCFGPEVPLSAFNGLASDGNWTIEVSDQAGADSGSLNSWTVGVCVDL
jgi:subtilisin-like proprotein convertase family protein